MCGGGKVAAPKTVAMPAQSASYKRVECSHFPTQRRVLRPMMTKATIRSQHR